MSMFDRRTVLITGGTGTFGKAFLRHALVQGSAQVRVFSRDELKQSEMEQNNSDPRVKFICGDVRDLSSINRVCKDVDIVIHAAAMKRLETCEREPHEAVKTNVLGSMNVINACLENEVGCAIALSSDKAVYPANTYGRTKSLMESVWTLSNARLLEKERTTRFSVVRYGNVMGSRGSVADIFRKQAMEEGCVRITNPSMTRFFMPVEYAVDLVDLAIRTQQGGEIYVPTLKSTTIGDLARVISGGCPVKIIGPRPGEKIHEDILTPKEQLRSSLHLDVAIIDPEYCTWPYKFGSREAFVFPATSEIAPRMTDDEIRNLVERGPMLHGFGV